MPIEPRPPITVQQSQLPDTPPRPETPALRFLKRGQQLQRLQQHVIASITADIEREHAEFTKLTVVDSASALKAAGMAMSVVTSGNERWSDIHLMLQLFFCRHVDNFQIFLEETLRSIYRKQRDLLRKSDQLTEQVTVTQVLAHATIDAFVEELIENKIHKLAYKSIRALANILKKEDTKFDLFKDRKTSETVELMFDIRNLVTHNYGIVNKIFLTKHPDSHLSLDQPYPVLPAQIAEELQMLIAVTTDIEKRASQKFKLF